MTDPAPARALFPILFVSGWLLAYYQRALKAERRDSGALPLLLKSWWLGPRAIPLPAIQRASTNSYTMTLDEDFCCDEKGHSTLMLLEDGRPLPYPHATSVKKIASHGQGRWVHVGRKIFFSPSDNADLAKTPRQYHLIDGLGGNPEIFGALSKLAQLRTTFRNPAGYALNKLQLVLGKRLGLGKAKEIDAHNLVIVDLRLALDAAFLPDLAIDTVALNTSAAEQAGQAQPTRIQANLTGLRWGGIELDEVTLSLEIGADFQPRLLALSARGQGRTLVDLATTRRDGAWQNACLSLTCLAALRRQLALACGGAEAGAQWLDGILADLAADTLPMGLKLPEDCIAALRAAFSPEGGGEAITLDFTWAGQALHLAARA